MSTNKNYPQNISLNHIFKKFADFVAYLLVLSVAATLSPLKSQDNKWHEENALYRIELEHNSEKDEIYCVDLSNIIFPESISKGLTAHSENGDEIPFHFDTENSNLFFKNNSTEKTYIYFGFNTNQENSNWDEERDGPVPELASLQLHSTRAWFDNTKEEDMLKNQDYVKYLEIKDFYKKLAPLEAKIKKIDSRLKESDNPNKEDENQINNIKNEIVVLKKQMSEKAKELNINEYKIKNFKNKEDSLENNFKTKNKNRKFEAKSLTEILLDRNIIKDPKKDFACRVSGNFIVKEAGTYQFAINSTSYALLVINDTPVIDWHYLHDKSEDWEKIGEIHLPPGKHNLKFYAHIGEKSSFAAAAWKKPGKDNFSIIKTEDFYMPHTLAIKSCQDKNGNFLPLIRASFKGRIFTDRINFLYLLDCKAEAIPPKIIKLQWKLNNTRIGDGDSIQCLINKEGQNQLVLVIPQEKTYDAEYDMQISELKQNEKVIEPEIFMDTSFPQFIFDDETLYSYVSVYSLTPEELKTLFKIQSNPVNNILPAFSELINLPSKDKGSETFSPPEIVSRTFKIDGSKLSTQKIFSKLSLSIPPVEFKEEYFSIVPLSSIKDFSYSTDTQSLTDSRGRKIVLCLHRPTLAEKRTWSFAHSIAEKIKINQKTIIISDDFGYAENTLSKNLLKTLGRKNDLSFIAWKKQDYNSTMLANLPDILQTLRNSDAKRIIIIPSSFDSASGIPSRFQARIICALLQTARENKNISKIILCTPFPNISQNTNEEELVKTIKTTIYTDFAVDKILDIYGFVKSKDQWQAYYREELNSPYLISTHPKFMIELIAEFISNAL